VCVFPTLDPVLTNYNDTFHGWSQRYIFEPLPWLDGLSASNRDMDRLEVMSPHPLSGSWDWRTKLRRLPEDPDEVMEREPRHDPPMPACDKL